MAPCVGPCCPVPSGDELAADLDHGRIMDLDVAGHLRLRLGRPDGRREEQREASPSALPVLFCDTGRTRRARPAIA